MASHQHALVRYVTLDRCLSRHRFTKEELLARCSAAVSDFTGDHRQMSERTFFNDLQAMRDGIILGRRARIVCTEGRYAYEDRGSSLFMAGDADVAELSGRLADMEGRVAEALQLLDRHNAPAEVVAQMREVLLGGDVFGWAMAMKRKGQEERRGVRERLEGDEQRAFSKEQDSAPRYKEQRLPEQGSIVFKESRAPEPSPAPTVKYSLHARIALTPEELVDRVVSTLDPWQVALGRRQGLFSSWRMRFRVLRLSAVVRRVVG